MVCTRSLHFRQIRCCFRRCAKRISIPPSCTIHHTSIYPSSWAFSCGNSFKFMQRIDDLLAALHWSKISNITCSKITPTNNDCISSSFQTVRESLLIQLKPFKGQNVHDRAEPRESGEVFSGNEETCLEKKENISDQDYRSPTFPKSQRQLFFRERWRGNVKGTRWCDCGSIMARKQRAIWEKCEQIMNDKN